VLSHGRPPGHAGTCGAGSQTTSAATDPLPRQRLIPVLLLAAAAMDLARCGLFVMAARHPAPAGGLAAAGLAATALSARTARGCRAGRRWAAWAAFLIGATSAPQAAASGFHSLYAIPDTATAVLGILLTVAVLATAGRQPGHHAENPCVIDR
jgi:hypothetical protein